MQKVKNYRYESTLTKVRIIDPNEICIAMIDGNLSISLQPLAFLCLFKSNWKANIMKKCFLFEQSSAVFQSDF